MMVLGPKHVGAFLMCKFYKFYMCAVFGIIIEWLDNMHGVTTKVHKLILLRTEVFLVFVSVCHKKKSCCSLTWWPSSAVSVSLFWNWNYLFIPINCDFPCIANTTPRNKLIAQKQYTFMLKLIHNKCSYSNFRRHSHLLRCKKLRNTISTKRIWYINSLTMIPRELIRVAVSNDLMSYNCVNTVDCEFVYVLL